MPMCYNERNNITWPSLRITLKNTPGKSTSSYLKWSPIYVAYAILPSRKNSVIPISIDESKLNQKIFIHSNDTVFHLFKSTKKIVVAQYTNFSIF
jgi:hypothetical protein